MNNRNKKLGEIAHVTMGLSPSGKSYNYIGMGLPLLNGPTEFGTFSPNCTLYTTDSKRECKRGDLIFCVRGNTTGRMNWADTKYSLGRGVCSIRGKTTMDTKYIKCCLSSYLPELLQMAGGSTMPNLRQSVIKQFQIPYPSYRHKIVTILSAYDDLIENNLRRIEILEEMALALYREWFVHFRFPGHEKVRFVDSPLGKIPEGWEVVPFTEIADVLGGGTPKTDNPGSWNGNIPFFTPRDSPDLFFVKHTQKTITKLGLSKCSSKLYPKETVFITARGTVGKVVMAADKMAINQSCYALRGKKGISQHYLFLTAKEQSAYLKRNTGGATFETIITDTFHRMLVVHPKMDIINQFTTLIQPVMELILNLIIQNTVLSRTCDLLLPRLISSELDVSELDIDVSDVS